MAAASLSPITIDAAGAPRPLGVPNPKARLDFLAQEVARRTDVLPQGVGHVAADRLRIGVGLPDALRPLLDAPAVAAEVAAGLRPALPAGAVLRLMSLRSADPDWFDAALPAALTLALEETP